MLDLKMHTQVLKTTTLLEERNLSVNQGMILGQDKTDHLIHHALVRLMVVILPHPAALACW